MPVTLRSSSRDRFTKTGSEGSAPWRSRTMDTMGVDYQVIFPTAMLHLGMSPMEDAEIEVEETR